MILACDIRASFTRYEAARLSMWMAWARAEEVLNPEFGRTVYDRDRYASTQLDAEAVKKALVHAAKDPECAIWVYLPSGALTAWPAFESPRDWSWAMLEDWRDVDAVPQGWHDMPYATRLATVMERREDIQEEWEATVHELRAGEAMRSQWADTLNREYLTQTAQNPAP